MNRDQRQNLVQEQPVLSVLYRSTGIRCSLLRISGKISFHRTIELQCGENNTDRLSLQCYVLCASLYSYSIYRVKITPFQLQSGVGATYLRSVSRSFVGQSSLSHPLVVHVAKALPKQMMLFRFTLPPGRVKRRRRIKGEINSQVNQILRLDLFVFQSTRCCTYRS